MKKKKLLDKLADYKTVININNHLLASMKREIDLLKLQNRKLKALVKMLEFELKLK